MITAAIVITVLCALAPVVAAYVERRMVWPYSTPEPVSQIPTESRYLMRQVSEALQSSFRLLGRARDLKGERYAVDYYFLVSPQQDTLAIVGVGTIMRIPVNGTWLFSRGDNGAAFYSVNNQSCAEFDLSGLWKDQILFDAGFQKLYEAHFAWLQKTGATVVPFTSGRELDELRQVRFQRVEAMRRKGLVRSTDADAEHWQYTLLGAIKCGFGTYFVGLFRHLKAGKF
ncbi:MAG TPA: hypothetical protein PKA41_12475 [Verrucomicrobiota bacterium]|nr:hypothetical protein [Verrucomicrobiota bacterium]